MSKTNAKQTIFYRFYLRRGKQGICVAECSLVVLRDAQFVGEDAALAAALARRLPPPDLGIAESNVTSEQTFADAHLDDTWNLLLRHNDTRRKYPHAYEKDPTEAQVEIMALKMMEQSCYSTQYRLKEVSNTIREYEDDPLFRMAYSFKQLEDWEREILTLYSFTQHSDRESPKNFRIERHIDYFTHAVRKMIDVTYTVEYIIHLNSRVLEPKPG